MRITQKMVAQSALNGMQTNLRRLSDLQRQAVTTKRVNRPEDDPFAVEQGLGFRTKIKASETARDNIAQSKDWLNATDKSLSDVSDLLTRAKTLALQGINGSLGPDERQSVSIEINQMLEEALALGNTRHGDDYLFSGFNINSPAFVETRDAAGKITAVAANGDITGQIVREVEPGTDMAVNVPGDTVFTNVFTTLINTRDALAQNPFDPSVVSAALTDLDTQLDNTLDIQAAVGTKVRRLTVATERMQATEAGLHELLSKAEDADMPEVVSDLNQQQFIYQTALNVNGRVLSTSLLDFIR